MRQKVNKRFAHHFHKVSGDVTDTELAWIDFRFSNLCNYKCISCGPHLSSKWDNGTVTRPNVDIISEVKPHLSQIEAIYFGGGEPLLMREHIDVLKALINLNKRDVHLSYNTNLSHLNYEGESFLEFWRGFKNVEVWVSLDGHGEHGFGRAEGLHFTAHGPLVHVDSHVNAGLHLLGRPRIVCS